MGMQDDDVGKTRAAQTGEALTPALRQSVRATCQPPAEIDFRSSVEAEGVV